MVKNPKLIRFISFMLTIIMMIAVFSACGKDNTSTGTTGNSSTASQTTSTVKKEEPPKKISILLSHAGATYTKAVTNWEDNVYAKELERITGYDLKFEFLGHAEYLQQLTVRFASGDLPDLIRTDKIDSIAHPTAVENNIFTEIGPLLDKYGPNIKKGIPEEEWVNPKLNKNGKLYAIPALLDYAYSKVLYIRQDWLDKFGMKAPVTMDDYLKYFEAVKNLNTDPNADPNSRIYGFYARENMGYSELFFKQFGVSPSDWEFKDGQYSPSMINPKMKDAIKYWKMLYDKQYVNPDLFVLKGTDWTARIFNGKGGSWLHDAGNYSTSWTKSAFINQPNVNLTMTEGPVNANNEVGMYPRGTRYYFGFVIPTKVKNPEVVIQFLDKVYSSEECDNFFTYGIKDKNYTIVNGKVSWSKESDSNKTDLEYLVYQLSINVKGSNMSAKKILDLLPEGQKVIKAYETASKAAFKSDIIYMPGLETFKTKPELVPGFGPGTLFLDMFAKAITGKEDADKAFDNFVDEWKKRGGSDAIKEATTWYNNFKKK